MKLKVGVLAVQGSFVEHVSALKELDRSESGGKFNLEIVEVRSAKNVTKDLVGLIIPGGESTTLNIFLQQNDFYERLKVWMSSHPRPVVWGTCAGMILLSDEIEQQKSGGQLKIGGMPISTSRNYFGRQKKSFVAEIHLIDKKLRNCGNDDDNANNQSELKMDVASSFKNNSKFPGIFIRAPGIASIREPDSVEILATLQIGLDDFVPVALRHNRNNLMVSSFHPELTQDFRFHNFFVEMILENCSKI